MPLRPGTRFGHYEVLAPLGAGGMGEVYRARDTKLGRDVASSGRFIMLSDPRVPTSQFTIVLNWFEELKRLVPP